MWPSGLFLSPSRRLAVVIGLFSTAIMIGAVVTVFVPRGQEPHFNWHFPDSIPVLSIGADFRIFVTAAQTMFEGDDPLHTNYNSPPFTALVFVPFVPLSETVAYRIQFYLTIAENCLILILLSRLSIFLETHTRDGSERVALVGLCLLTLSTFQFFGYPLEFALERGNYDSLALLSMCLGVWLSVRHRSAFWLPIVFLSLATHLKVYPAVLLGLPLWQHRKRAIASVLAINLLLLFCFGFARGIEFLRGLYVYSRHPFLWIGNHSAQSFSNLVLAPFLRPGFGRAADVLALGLTLGAPLVLWVDGTVRLVRSGWSPSNAVLAFALSVPLMCLLPSVSNDYKLVILLVPSMVCLLFFADSYVLTGRWMACSGLVATLCCLIGCAQSVLFHPIFFTPNKYPVVLILFCLTYYLVRSGPVRQASREGSPVPPGAGSSGRIPA